MKQYVLTSALFLCLILNAQADIYNGFYYDILKLEKTIARTQDLLSETTNTRDLKKLEKELKRLNKKMRSLQASHAETEALIKEVWQIDSGLCAKVSRVTNAEGTLTHVYVKVVSRTSEEYINLSRHHYVACAYTSVGQEAINAHVCTSRAGTNTVTITVAYGCDALKALGHEYAHVLYIVPNLATYMKFWTSNDDFHNGHSKDDPSYFFLNEIEQNYLNRYIEYTQSKRNLNERSF